MQNLLMDEIKEEAPGAASGYKEQTEEGTKKTEADGEKKQEVDEYGYVTPAKEDDSDDKKESNPEDNSKKSDDDPEKKTITGYEEEDPKKPEEDPKKPEEDPKKPEEVVLENTEGLLPEEIASLQEFVKKHGVNKELAQALVEQKKQGIKAYEEYVAKEKQEREAQTRALKESWKTELKTDPDFGGEKFRHNLKQVDRIIDEFLPNLKKTLTEGGGMLPPYVMRDLAKFADHLYSTEKLVQGDPIKLDQGKEQEGNDPLAFYNHSKEN